ncbi:hypothetical protein RSAG8_05191, partial [Rhizoctonia solani AG-8 WAC10335]
MFIELFQKTDTKPGSSPNPISTATRLGARGKLQSQFVIVLNFTTCTWN